jgi:hypothetical protein
VFIRLCVFGVCAFALVLLQPAYGATLQSQHFDAVKTATPPALDAALTEPVWWTALTATNFEDFTDQGPARVSTTTYLLYDDHNLYVGFVCDQAGVPITATQTVNDIGSGLDDTVTIAIDTSGANARTYSFSATPRGVRYESSSESSRYNPQWQAVASRSAVGYRVMMVIPLRDMRLQSGRSQAWRIDFSRRVAATNTLLTWAYDSSSNAYCANGATNVIVYCDATRWPTVAGFAVPAGARPKPYADIYALGSTGSQRDVFETRPSTFTAREPRTFGLDANIPLTSTLAFVGTLAPDFSNVEADQTTIAPQEFPIRYTEYRPFFAQGSQYIDAIPTFNINRYKYDAFYSPSIGVLDTGYKLEGTVGSNAIGALDAHGPGVNDQVFGYSNTRPDGSLAYSAGAVDAHHDGIVDDTLGFGGSFTNLHTGLQPIVNFSADRGTNVTDTAQANSLNAGVFEQKGTVQAGFVYRDIGSQYAPIDAYTTLSDIRGPQGFIQQYGTGAKGSAVKSYQLFIVADRFFDRSGAVHAADTVLYGQVVFTNLLSIAVTGGASELRTYAQAYPSYTQPVVDPFNQTQIAIGYKDSTPSPLDLTYSYGPFGVVCSGVAPQPLPCGTSDRTAPSFLQQIDLSTTRALKHGYGVSFEYGGSVEHGVGVTSDSQWLRRLSLTRALGTEGQLQIGLRSINGTGGFATPGTDIAISYHQRLRDESNLYIEYGTPGAPATLHRLILKFVKHIGGGAGT